MRHANAAVSLQSIRRTPSPQPRTRTPSPNICTNVNHNVDSAPQSPTPQYPTDLLTPVPVSSSIGSPSQVNRHKKYSIDQDYHNTPPTASELSVNRTDSLSHLDSLYDVPRSAKLAPPPPPPPCSSSSVKVHKYVNAASKVVSTEPVESTGESLVDLDDTADTRSEMDVFMAMADDAIAPGRPYKPRNLSDPTTLDGNKSHSCILHVFVHVLTYSYRSLFLSFME